jgi:protocatechuate 3,4-dioxygenase beta subunit
VARRCRIAGFFAVAGLAVPAAWAPTGATAATCRPTKPDAVGPFESTAVSAPRRSKIGTGHVLLGRVLSSPDCKPIAGAIVELWQSGPSGYTKAGRGSVVTDRLGGFRFEGPVPASDGGFPPHIHIAVRARGYDDLISRYVVPAGERTGHVTLVLEPLL